MRLRTQALLNTLELEYLKEYECIRMNKINELFEELNAARERSRQLNLENDRIWSELEKIDPRAINRRPIKREVIVIRK